ncbi:MAG: leucyl/phenylalanyl-tRNA--protein transferase, partial [Bdellovibrionales bacterium]|nr:leucyl/phenylalanyl-tRNA--protein transferase [Bdellovibrionales bacterium]
MVIERFPDVSDADENGLLAIGGDLEVGSLLLAYRSGIFPWPYSSRYPAWFAPPQRALIMLDEFHV